MQQPGRKSNITKYPRNLNNINIGMVFFAVMAIYIIISVVTYLRKDHIVGYQVMAGSLSTNNIYDAVAVRQEKIINSETAGYVNYLGFRKDIDQWIEKCHCTILASYGGEGVPNVLLESAATGRICIASNINGSRDVIDDGVTGYLFEKGNSKDLMDKVESFLALSDEDKAKMGKAGREKIEKEFNREIVVKKYLMELEALAGKDK